MSQDEAIGIDSYTADVETSTVVAALKRDGAVIVRNQVEDQTADAVSPSFADLVGHPRVLEIADAILLPNCVNHLIGSLTGIEIHPGETDQFLQMRRRHLAHPAADGLPDARQPGLVSEPGRDVGGEPTPLSRIDW
jgi:hypothetical protein